MFKDRKDAGIKLAEMLSKYKGKGAVVLAIPRGGVEVGYEVAKALDAEFSLIVSRKLGYPENPEAGFGAVAEDGSYALLESGMPGHVVERIKKEQIAEAKRRVQVLRGGKPLPEITGKTVILVDDGLAMGVTMEAAIMLCRKQKAGKIIVAVPVSGEDVANKMRTLADELVVLEMPEFFYAVAQAYEKWYDVSDGEVLEIMKNISHASS